MSNRSPKIGKNTDMTIPAAEGRQASPDPVVVRTDDAVRIITLNRPDALNSFDSAMKPALLAALSAAAADDVTTGMPAARTGAVLLAPG